VTTLPTLSTLAPESNARPATAFARHLPTAARTLLGLTFFVFGLEGFLHFMPQPSAPPPAGAMALGLALMKSGYLFQLIKGTEVTVGALLLSNRFVPLALVLIAPVVVNILAFHAFLAPSGLGLAAVIVLLEAYLAWCYRDAYRSVLAPRAAPYCRPSNG
jgi:hypothetical protein